MALEKEVVEVDYDLSNAAVLRSELTSSLHERSRNTLYLLRMLIDNVLNK